MRIIVLNQPHRLFAIIICQNTTKLELGAAFGSHTQSTFKYFGPTPYCKVPINMCTRSGRVGSLFGDLCIRFGSTALKCLGLTLQH